MTNTPKKNAKKTKNAVQRFLDKGVNSIYRGGARVRTYPGTTRGVVATAVGALALGPVGGVLGGLYTAGIATIETKAAAMLQPKDIKPDAPNNWTESFKRDPELAAHDATAIADIASFIATDKEMIEARANWKELNLSERQKISSKVSKRFCSNYPDVEPASVCYIYYGPKTMKLANGEEKQGIVGGAYVPINRDDVPFLGRLMMGNARFSPRVMINSHPFADEKMGGFDGMIEVICHECTHHVQGIIGRRCLMAKGRGKDLPAAYQNAGHKMAEWYENILPGKRMEAVQKLKKISEDTDAESRKGKLKQMLEDMSPIKTMRDYLSQDIEAHAFSNGMMSRKLSQFLADAPEAERAARLANIKENTRKMMADIEVMPEWTKKGSTQGYKFPSFGNQVLTANPAQDDKFTQIFKSSKQKTNSPKKP